MFAGLLPHDGSAGGGGAAGHGCCREAKREDTWERGERESIEVLGNQRQMEVEDKEERCTKTFCILNKYLPGTGLDGLHRQSSSRQNF